MRHVKLICIILSLVFLSSCCNIPNPLVVTLGSDKVEYNGYEYVVCDFDLGDDRFLPFLYDHQGFERDEYIISDNYVGSSNDSGRNYIYYDMGLLGYEVYKRMDAYVPTRIEDFDSVDRFYLVSLNSNDCFVIDNPNNVQTTFNYFKNNQHICEHENNDCILYGVSYMYGGVFEICSCASVAVDTTNYSLVLGNFSVPLTTVND